ncbi:MAG: hypothetical protein VX627_04700 [Candidatus Thermoplasmatota archaeon]|nr:hypothetical protein [Candidatus Thermoplasmatota archaeon]
MRERMPWSIALVILLITPLLIAAPTALRTAAHEGVVYTSDQTWSGNMTLDDNIIIASGATLTIESGTQINVTEDITITMNGDLDIQGTSESPVEIWGSWVAETSIQARWQGFLLNPGSSANVVSTHISDSRGGFDVESGATLNIAATNFTDTIIGVWNKGTLSGDGLNCNTATTSCLRVDGSATLSEVNSMISAEVVHVHNGGDANIAVVTSNDDADVIVLDDGSTFYGEVNADGFNRLIRGSGTVSATVMPDVIGVGGVLVEADTLGGLVVTGGSPCGSNCTVDSIIVGSVDDVEFSSLFVYCEETCIDARIDGELAFVGAWPSTEVYPSNAFARLRGDGLVRLNQITIHSTQTLFDVSGNGNLIIDSSTLRYGGGVGTISGWSLDVSNTIMVDGAEGWVLLDVDATFSQVEIVRPFSLSDSTSVGIHAVWSNIVMHDVMLDGWNEGIRCESECIVTGTDLTSGGGGRNSGSGITIDGGMIELDSLSTSSSDVGIDLIDGSVHIGTWVVENAHRSYGIQLANDASATIRNMPAYTSSGVHDGFGDGTLLWGSEGTPDLSVSIEERFTESVVQVTDLVGNSISGATASAHGFSEVTNESGESLLPMLASGSFVEAVDGSSGMGASATLSPPGGDIQIAIVPGTGDWTIPTGIDARLVGGEHSIAGDLIIENGASLMLVDSTLTIPESANLTIQSTGRLKGDGGVLFGGVAPLTAGTPLQGEGDGLIVGSQITFTCYDPWTWVKTSLTNDLTLSQDCELILDGGHASGSVTLSEDSKFSERSHLTVRVVDAGNPVEGANVSVGGNVVQTDATGTVSFTSTWRVIDENGESIADSKTVAVQHANVNRYRSWDPSISTEIEVMISTVTAGVTTNHVRLESVFSPYHLGSDLIVADGSTFEILPNVELTLATGVGIRVEGEMLSDDSWIGGTGSAGLQAIDGGSITLQSGFYSGGPLQVGSNGESTLNNMTIFDAALSVISTTTSAQLHLNSGLVKQTDICIRAQGMAANLVIENTRFEMCEMMGVWSTTANVEISGATIGPDNSKGFWIQDSGGSITDLDATEHDGDGSALHLEMQDESLIVERLEIAAGTGVAALQIEQSTGVQIRDSVIHNAPGVLIDNSVTTLERVDLLGTGTGTGIEILGARNSGAVQIIDCDVDHYDKALRLEGAFEHLEAQPITIQDSHLHGTTSIDANTLPFVVRGGEIDGEVRLLAMEKAWSATIIDVEIASTNLSGEVRLYIGSTWQVLIQEADSGNPIIASHLQMVIPEFDSTLGEQSLDWENPDQIELIYRVHSDSSITDAQYAQWTTSSSGFLPETGQLMLDTSGERILVAQMSPNLAPVVTILEPVDNLIVNAGEDVDYSASFSDPNGDDIIEWIWLLEGEDVSWLVGDQSSDTISGIEQGEWILKAIAIDIHGAQGQAIIHITVNPADNDGDFSETCQTQGPDAWYDPISGLLCGPDVFDDDDDNDDIRDDRDDFPFDRCAHKDTDNDGMPDSILPNCETPLIEDGDDDNDEVPDGEDIDPVDASKGRTTDTESESSLIVTLCSPSVVLSIGLVVLFTIFAYLRFRGGEGGAVSLHRDD